jgi:hypothetical protein
VQCDSAAGVDGGKVKSIGGMLPSRVIYGTVWRGWLGILYQGIGRTSEVDRCSC